MTGGERSDVVVSARLAAAIERIGAAARGLLRSAAAAEGLSPTQAQVLIRLHTTADEPAQHGSVALARWLDVSTPTISDSVSALERKGHVTRRARTQDPRRVQIDLTDTGRAAAERLSTWDVPLRRALSESGELPSGASDSLAAMLDRCLRTIAALQRVGVVSVARTCHSCRFFDDIGRGESPYWCNLLDAPLEQATLRIDCPEHETQPT